MRRLALTILAASLLGLPASLHAGEKASPEASGTIGSGGSAAAGGNSATTLGTGATSTEDGSTSSSLATGGSAASAEGRTDTKSKVNANDNNLQGQSKASARDGGTWARSQTKTKVKAGEELSSRTKSMSHVPGEKPTKSTTRVETDLN